MNTLCLQASNFQHICFSLASSNSFLFLYFYELDKQFRFFSRFPHLWKWINLFEQRGCAFSICFQKFKDAWLLELRKKGWRHSSGGRVLVNHTRGPYSPHQSTVWQHMPVILCFKWEQVNFKIILRYAQSKASLSYTILYLEGRTY